MAIALLATPLGAQEGAEPAAEDSVPIRVPRGGGSTVLVPLGSLFLPGLGQFVHRDPAAGGAFAGTALVGIGLSAVGDPWVDSADEIPRRGRDQLAEQALTLVVTSGSLSAWDAFYRALPAQQARGRYQFLERRERLEDLVTAPFDTRFLRRWTTWVDLAQTVAITTLILSERRSGTEYHPFRPNDAAYAASLSMNAAVGEEALFRGWLLPVLHQQTGERFWLANGIQASVFGAAHLPAAEGFAAYIAAWAAWQGWIVRRNEWSVRESIFHHFWYDVAVVTASLLTHERTRGTGVHLISVSFRR